jgi:type IV pilus assembly protein PilY1
MSELVKKIRVMAVSVLCGMMISYPAVAEDIEIYKSTGSVSSSSQANVLLVLDTSGSMGTMIDKRADYDPTVDYSGGAGCYDNDKVYVLPYGTDNANLHCTWPWYFFYGSESNLAQANRSAVVCDAASSLDNLGFFTGRLAQYRGGQWNDSMITDTDFVECEADSGVHGQTTASAETYASSTNGPWSSDPGDEINWGSDAISATIYTGHYINYIINAPIVSSVSRIDTMKDVITKIIDTTSGINLGLMRFDRYSEGGMIATPVDDINTNEAALKTALSAMTANGGTPLSESFYEAAMYFQGKAVDYGNSSSPYHSVASSTTGAAYKSPIVDECQKNYIVILTDGDPTSDSLSSTRRARLGISSCSGNCLDEISKAIATRDQSTSLDEEQNISTFTIGFAIDNQLLIDTASESKAATGIGERFLADDYDSLTDQLNKVLETVYETDATFSSPAVSVNAFNRSTHLNDLYFTLFKPSNGARWPGNFKKYKLDFFEDVDDVDADDDTTERLPFIADANSADAIENGFFSDASRSFWSVVTDGGDVAAGGAANALPASRNVFTYTDTYTNDGGVFRPTASGAQLTAAANAVDKTNTNITDVMLDITGEPDVFTGTPRIETLLDWSKGLDVFDIYGAPGTRTDPRLEIGDPLHAEPALVQYGGTADAPDLVAFVATNDGYLHAFDADTGVEEFAFIPQELLPNLNELMDNPPGDKIYGLDGSVTAWVNDEDGNGIISGSEHVYLYFGMRRGGKNIYSLDVTDRNNPKLRWVIQGGVGDYAELGQTWSTVNVGKIKDGATERDVIIFGGGYDVDQDNAVVRTADDEGRAVYIADANTGELLWSAGKSGSTIVSEMDYSIPGRVVILDVKGDGFTDRLYVADVGGQMFRFDIDNDNGSSLTSSVSGGRVVDIAKNGSKADMRRFYYPPDVALIAPKGEQAYIAVAASSGNRSHPLNIDVQDRIYMFKDYDVFRKPSSYTTLTEADLYDATLNLVAGDGDEAANDAAAESLETSDGWMIKLDDGTNTDTWIGEKGLAEPLIISGNLIVTTFTPSTAGVSTSKCAPASGLGKVYMLNVIDASAAYPSDLDVRTDRVTELSKEGIPPKPNVVIPEGGEPTICVGTECQPEPSTAGARKTYWYEVEK